MTSLASRLRRRVVAQVAGHPIAADALALLLLWAVFTLGATTPGELERPHGRVIGALVNIVLLAPLTMRRRAPLAVLVTVGAVTAYSTLALDTTGGEIALALALAAFAARESGDRTLAAAVVSTLAAAAAASQTLPEKPLGTLALVVACGTAAAAIGTAIRYGRDLVRAREEREARLAEQRHRDAALAIAAERARIARELHDIVAHHVSVMVRLADGAQAAAHASPDRAREAMAQIASTGRETLTDLRGLLGVLHDDRPDDVSAPAASDVSAPQPDLSQLPGLIDRVRSAGVPARLHTEGEQEHLPSGVQLAVYRLVQEALTNVLRHGREVTAADVLVRYSSAALEVSVTNDGRPTAGTGEGRGLTGMRERVAMHGAHLLAGPRPGGGWSVSAVIPLITGSGPSGQRAAAPAGTMAP